MIVTCNVLKGEREKTKEGVQFNPLARYCWKENPVVTMVSEPTMVLHCSVSILSCMHRWLQEETISAQVMSVIVSGKVLQTRPMGIISTVQAHITVLKDI